jgi:hypothetical protein
MASLMLFMAGYPGACWLCFGGHGSKALLYSFYGTSRLWWRFWSFDDWHLQLTLRFYDASLQIVMMYFVSDDMAWRQCWMATMVDSLRALLNR